jgi:hypothetical protein
MSRAGCSFLVLSLFVAPAASAQTGPQTGQELAHALQDAGVGTARSCEAEDPKAVVVCGTARQPYRIDPTVLAATREADAAPPKPPLGGDIPQATCSGPQCGGATIPLVGMALTALKAAELAAEGDDWRDAFRTRPDPYSLYERKKAEEKKPRVSIGVSAGSK